MTDEEMAEEYYYKTYPITLNIGEEERKKEVTDIFLAGLEAGRPKWHKVADGDLPKHEVNVLVFVNKQCIDIAHYNYDYKEWHFSDSICRDVIAWCEIPQYEEG